MLKKRCGIKSHFYFTGSIAIMLIFLIIATASYAEEMSALIEGAKKEGKVIYYTGMSLNPDVVLLVRDFEKKYPFLKVVVLRLSGEKLLTKALAEAAAKNLQADIFQTSVIEVSHMKDKKLLRKYVSPESQAFGTKFRDPEGFWNAVFILPYVITYNTKLVPRQEAPKTYGDLLNPRWKGKIGIESEELQWFFHLIKIMGREKGIEYMKRLATQNLSFRSGHQLLNTLCISGEIPIVVVSYLNDVELLKSEGAPIDWVNFGSLPTITSIHAISLVTTAPHPNAAKLFYNFVISREGAQSLKKSYRIPARQDEQPPEFKGMNLYPAFPDELLANYKQVVKEWEEIFNPK